MRRELLWAALWLWTGAVLGLVVRPAIGQSVSGRAPVPPAGAVAPLAAPLAGNAPRNLAPYAGLWYDIAATDDRFHEGCRRDASTRYTLRPDATLQVVNRCRDASGGLRDAEGVLRLRPAGRLQLRYAPDWMAWLPLAWSEVRVVELDAGYRHAVLATPDLTHLWVLAREPVMSTADYEAVLARLRAMGAGTEGLRRFPQGEVTGEGR